MLVFTILFIVLPKGTFSANEKRYLAEFPELKKETLLDGTYTEEIENYLADHAPLRSLFVGINSYYSYLTGNNGSNGIYLGKDGFLIEKPVNDFERLEMNSLRVAGFAKNLDIPVTFALAPSKGYVYSDKLPLNHLEYNDQSNYKVVADAVSGCVNFIDLSQILIENKGDVELYYKTDHHWTTYGAYLAYVELCDSFGIERVDEAQFEKSYVDGFNGTSYSGSGYWLTDSDVIEVWENKSLNVTVEIDDGAGAQVYDTMFFDEQFASTDKYNGFLNGNHSVVKIKNATAQGGRLLVVKDSFAHCLVPFLAEHYSEIVMVDLRYYRRALTDLIADNEIDEVLFLYSIDNFTESTDIVLR